MPGLRIISASDVYQLLPMVDCVDVMADAMKAASNGEVHVPLRTIMPLIDESAHFALMPGSARNPDIYGAKILSLHYDNLADGLPAIQGFVTLFEHEHGTPIAIIEGSSITALRTAAASGLATRLLAREDASTHGVFGTSVQAEAHIDSIAAVRSIERVIVWGRNIEKAETLAERMSERYEANIVASHDPAEAAACDVISTTTAASEPILRREWIHDGTHINLVGSHSPTAREADSALMADGAIYTDRMESLLNEGGDFVIPLNEGLVSVDGVRGEIGNLLLGLSAGRQGEEEITIYKSHGITAQDLFAAHYIYQRSIESGTGTEVEF